MGGHDQQVIGHRRHKLLEALVKDSGSLLHRILKTGNPIQQVRTTYVTDKNEISGESSERLGRFGTVGYYKRNMFRRMTWSVPNV